MGYPYRSESPGATTVGDHHGGAGEQFAQTLIELVSSCSESGALEAGLADGARDLVRRARAANLPVHGFGHPQHAEDPRVRVLRTIAEESGVAGRYCLALDAVESALAEAVGRRIPTNIDVSRQRFCLI